MTRFVVRPTGPYESDGYSVVDTNREDERGRQIGRGLEQYDATHLSNMLNAIACSFSSKHTRERLLAIFAACADAHDDYLSDEERRANREAHEKSAEQASKMPAALRECRSALGAVIALLGKGNVAQWGNDPVWGKALRAETQAKEALGE